MSFFLRKWWIVILISVYFILISFSSTFASTKYNYHISSVSEYFKNNVLEIQYNPWFTGSDGLVIFTKFENLTNSQKLILPNGLSIVCGMKVHGIYYSNPRGLRILPLSNLDKEFLKKLDTNYGNVDVEGGLYTHCVGEKVNYNSMFGFVKWDSNKLNLTGALYIGYKVYVTGVDLNDFINSVGFIGGTKFVGWIYDTVAGAGFMGGMFTGEQISQSRNVLNKMMDEANLKSMDEILTMVGNKLKISGTSYTISTNNTIINLIGSIIVKGILSFSEYKNNISDVFSVNGNRKFADIDSINYRKYYKDILDRVGGKQNAILLKTKIYNISNIINRVRKNVSYMCRGRWSTEIDSSKRINCINGEGGNVVIDISDYVNGAYIVVKNGNLVIQGAVPSDRYYNVFVDNGKLILSNNLYSVDNLHGDAIYLKGNYIVNGIIGGNGPGGVFNHQLIVKGRVATLNTLGIPSNSRLEIVKFITNDSSVGANNINLNDIFTWSLGLDGKGTDGRKPYDKYLQQALVIEAGNYSSFLLK